MGKTLTKPRWDRVRANQCRARGGVLHYRIMAESGIAWQNGTIPQGELLSVKASNRYVLVGRWIHAGVIVRELHPVEGMCRVCRCTWSRACKGGCSWTSADRNLCTNCERRAE